MWQIYLPLLASIGVINFTGIVVWAVSSFGNGIVYHVGWQLCTLLSGGRVCSGSISEVVVHITLAALFLFPSQLFILREHVNWRLAMHLTLSQQLGLYAGMYVLFVAETVWLGRGMGVLFFLVSVHMAVTEGGSKPPAAPVAPASIKAIDVDALPPPPTYAVDSWARRGAVWLTGASSGLCSGLFGTGGPPMMLFVAWNSLPSTETRATLAFCEVVNNTGRVLFLLFFQSKINVLSAAYGGVFVALSVSSAAGLVLGNVLARWTDQALFRRVLLVLLAAGSVLIAARGCPWQQGLAVAIGGAAVMAAAMAASALWARCRRRSSSGSGGSAGNSGDESGSSGVALMDRGGPNGVYLPVSYMSPTVSPSSASKKAGTGRGGGSRGDADEDVDVLASFLEEECPAPGTQGSDSPPTGLWAALFGGNGGARGGGGGKDKKYVAVDSADLDDDAFDNVLF